MEVIILTNKLWPHDVNTVSSDPKVSSMFRSQGKLKDGTLPEEARQLLKEWLSWGGY